MNKRFKTKVAALEWLLKNGFKHYNSTPTGDFYTDGSWLHEKLVYLRRRKKIWKLSNHVR